MANTKKESPKMERKVFSKVSGTLELPNLVDIQTKSFEEFVNKGVSEVLNDIFPIESNNKNIKLMYVSHEFSEPQYPVEQCKDHNRSYKRKLKVSLQLMKDGNIIHGGGLLGEIPWMTEAGTFIIKGVERVIVSQLIRSPGAYFNKERDKSGLWLYNCDVMPSRGTYLQFESDAKKVLYVRMDRSKKILATIFFRALGFTDKNEFTKLFGENEYIKETIAKDTSWDENLDRNELIRNAIRDIYEKLKPGEPYTEEGALATLKDKYFNPKKYDLGKAGRYKFKNKLSVYARLIDRYLAQDIFDDETGEVLFAKGTLVTRDVLAALKAKKVFDREDGDFAKNIKSINTEIDKHITVNVFEVFKSERDMNNGKKTKIIGTDLLINDLILTIPDIIASFSYYCNFIGGIGISDDIDHLSNRRVRTVGELLQNQFRVGLTRLSKNIQDKMSISNNEEDGSDTIKKYLQATVLTGAINEFFSTSQLSQFMDQTNPLAELTNKRRLSALGPGGLSKERAGVEVRDVHYSHYGRICPIETPEGPNIGLINNLSSFARINEYGFIETPYRKVIKETGEVLEEAEFLSADDEFDKYIAQASIKLIDRDGKKFIADDRLVARYRGEPVSVRKEDLDYVDVSPKQIVSVASACIPFLENDDGKRALMGANMQRQAIPLLRPESPYVGTGIEAKIAHDSGLAVLAEEDGLVTYVDCKTIKVVNTEGKETVYHLSKFARSNQGTSINQNPIVKLGDKVTCGQVIADGPAMENGELALGKNVLVAFMTWDGYNFEDAVIMSDRLVKDDVYTSIHIEEYDVDCRQTKNGDEEITRELQYAKESAKAKLDENGIVIPGTKVKEGDILVGKLTPKANSEPSADDRILRAIYGDKTNDGKDTSLRVPHGGAGIVVDVKILSKDNGDELNPGILKTIKVFVAQKRKISEGDKMAGRHGNKGVISTIVPVEDMPYLADGTPIDILLNPLGVPTRMNIGQVLELHLGYAAQKLGYKIATPVFEGVNKDELAKMMEEAGIDKDGKTILYDGKTGEPFNERISVGVMYMIKLAHMVDDKLHARSIGPYSLVTQQPLGGKAQNGGQRFGEMEVWALEAYGAAHTLQEIITLKSDDIVGRQLTYKAIQDGRLIPDAGIPEAFKVLQKEIQGLGIDCKLLDDEGNPIDIKEVNKMNDEDKYKIARSSASSSFAQSYSSYDNEFEDGDDIYYDDSSDLYGTGEYEE